MSALAPDPAVPRRDALLRPITFAGIVSDRLRGGVPVERCELIYAKYRFGDSLRVAYRCDDDVVSCRTGVSGGVPAPEVDAALWVFPDDRKLTSLAALGGRLVAYAPEHSATAACLDRRGRVIAYAKTGEAERRGLEHAAGLDVPRILATEPVLRIEAIHGERLDRAHDLRGLGAALARLHGLAPPRERFARLDLDRLATAAGIVARARPDAARAAERVLMRLIAQREDARGPVVCLHGDANLRNAIRRPDGRVALIDLEHLAAGPAAADLGHVLALQLAAGRPGRDLLAGYAAVARPPDADALRWHTAACMLARVALPAVSRVRPRTLSRLRALLDTAADLVTRERAAA
jgi:aminoglycoside phosphotransferase